MSFCGLIFTALIVLAIWMIYIAIIMVCMKLDKIRQEIRDFEPEKDNKIIRIDKIESKVPVYEIVYITLSKGQKKKYLITEENYIFDLIKSGELKIGDLF